MSQGGSPNHKRGDVVSDDITDEISAEDTGGFIVAGQQSITRRKYEDIARSLIESASPDLLSLEQIIDCAHQEKLSERELVKITVQLLDRKKEDIQIADQILRSGIKQNSNRSFEPQSTIRGHLTALIDFGDVKTYRSFLDFVVERQIKLEASVIEITVSHLLKRNLLKDALTLCEFLWDDGVLLSDQMSNRILEICDRNFNEDTFDLATQVHQHMRVPTSESTSLYLSIRVERANNRMADNPEDIDKIVDELINLLGNQQIESGKLFSKTCRLVSIRKGAASALQFIINAQDAGYVPNGGVVRRLLKSCGHYEDSETTKLLLQTILERRWPINGTLFLEIGKLIDELDDPDLYPIFRTFIDSQDIEQSVKIEAKCRLIIQAPDQDRSVRSYEAAMRALGELISVGAVLDRALFVQVADAFKVLLPNLKGRFESLIDWSSKNQSQQVLIEKFLQVYFEALIDSNQLHLLARTERLLADWPCNDSPVDAERVLRLAAFRGVTAMEQVLAFMKINNASQETQKFRFAYNNLYDPLLVLARGGHGKSFICSNMADKNCASCIWHLVPDVYREETVFTFLRTVSDLYTIVLFPRKSKGRIWDDGKKVGTLTLISDAYKKIATRSTTDSLRYRCVTLEHSFLTSCLSRKTKDNPRKFLAEMDSDWIDPAKGEFFLSVDRFPGGNMSLDERWEIVRLIYLDRQIKIPSRVQFTYLSLIPLKDDRGEQVSKNADKVMRVVEKSLREENPQIGLAECRKYLQAIGMKHAISPGLVSGSFAYFYPNRSTGQMVQAPRILVAISYLLSSANKVTELDRYIETFKEWSGEVHPAVWTNYLKSYLDQGTKVVDAYRRIEENEILTSEHQKTVLNVLSQNLEWDAAKHFLAEVQETSPLKEWQLLAETLAVAAANRHQIELAEWCLGTIRNSGTQPTLKVEKAVDKAKFRLSDMDPLVSISAARQVRDQVSIMLGDIRHDLNNHIAPLQNHLDSIDSALEQLAPEEDDNRHSRLIRKASNSSRQKLLKIEDLIERWGTLSEAHDDSESSAGADVESVCDGVKNLLSSELENGKVTLTIEVANQQSGKTLSVAMSEYQLDLVLRNLIKNSLRALSSTDKNRIITIRAYESEPEAYESQIEGLEYVSSNKIVVYDNGPGIAKELRKQIFDRGVTTKNERGIGRGLALVNQVVSSCGGTIEVSTKSLEEVSSADTFAQFTLTLPSANSVEIEEA
jgi:signal transduction histidine kinase